MSSDAEQLARLRVAAATERLPRDLGAWVLERIQIPAAERLRARTLALREAARLLPGSRYAKAKKLIGILEGLRAAGPVIAAAEIDPRSALGLALYALRIDPECPTGERQMLRILDY